MKSGLELQLSTFPLYLRVLTSYVINHYLFTNNLKQKPHQCIQANELKSGLELQSTTISLYFRVWISYIISYFLFINNVKQNQINKVYYCSCFYCIYQFFLDRLWCLQIKKCIYLIYFYMLKNDSRQIL